MAISRSPATAATTTCATRRGIARTSGHQRRHAGGPDCTLFQPSPDPGPRDLTPRRARVTIRADTTAATPRLGWVVAASSGRRHRGDVIAAAVGALLAHHR
jgi:hypothetical protein